MRVVATPEAQAFIAGRGGAAYVRPVRTKCCGGAMTMLQASTERPADVGSYAPVGPPELGVWFRQGAAKDLGDAPASGVSGGPEELLIELKGKRHPRLVACWDGCVFKM